MSLPETWTSARLSEICAINPRLPPNERLDDAAEVTFVPMSAIDEASGTISNPETRTYGEVAKGYTSFRERDVLFAKVTPCMENGKAAVAESLKSGIGFGSTEFHVLRPTELVLPEFLFQFIRQQAFRDHAASAFVGTGGLQRVPPEFLSRVKLPVPTIPEQQRIVDILHQAEMVAKFRNKVDELLARTRQQLFVEMFGEPNPKHNSRWSVIKIGSVVEVATGGTPSREQTNNYGGTTGWVKSTDLKDDVITATEERISQLGIERSNAKVFPKDTVLLAMYGQGQTRGRTGKLLIEAACNQACAALLPSVELIPDFIWTWLQLSYGAVRSLGRGGQQENLNLDIVRNIKLPKPPVALQQEFARRLGQLLKITKASSDVRGCAAAMLDVLRIEALTGEATSAWRERNSAEIAKAAQARDVVLRELGAKNVAPYSATLELSGSAPVVTVQRGARQWLLAELSEFQRHVLSAFLGHSDQPLLAEDADVFSRFCEDEKVVASLSGYSPSPNQIRRTLSQLSALGLIAKLTVPKLNALTGEREYLKAFRPLREEERTRLSDVAMLRRFQSGGDSVPNYFFTVEVDRETSERVGASGVFQVLGLTDDDKKDRTDLVDVGKHYASIEEVASDIAERLDVRVDQIVLEE